jgi:predicted aldo/keto reductase-like oxidoreductase
MYVNPIANLGHGCAPVLRLGLATRGNTHLTADDITQAVASGVNYLNWCGHDDGLAQAVRERRFDREQVVIAVQLNGRTRFSARREMTKICRTLGTQRIDVLTFYYVEEEAEWHEISGPGGALEALLEAQSNGVVRIIGLTTHQRALGGKWVESGNLDLLMIRYNAAHRGAESDVFPVTDRLATPVVAYTAQRWGALSKRTEDDPAGFVAPPAPEWYRFALANPSARVVLMAPRNGSELREDLGLLDDWRPPSADEFEVLCLHGRRVRQRARNFP